MTAKMPSLLSSFPSKKLVMSSVPVPNPKNDAVPSNRPLLAMFDGESSAYPEQLTTKRVIDSTVTPVQV